ncbi:MAG: alanine racemase, partial [Myxococcales bacterium]|nr:alanine racemase [Myxococcales bacterium]
ELPALARDIRAASKLRLMGLMTVPPASDDPEASRPHFRRLREAGEALSADGLLPHGLALSMGMSHDFEVAIEEGATIVRVGTALFGPRPARDLPASGAG